VTLFGSGYLLFAYLQRDLVERQGLLTNPQLIDAIMIGELTPGPLFTVSTVIGYLLAGMPGAVVATVAIFFPSFLFAIALGRLMPRVKRSKAARHLLRGLGATVLGIMLAVLAQVTVTVLTSVSAIALAAVFLATMLLTRVSALIVIPCAAVIGVIITYVS
jgi:chromate transporter